MKIHNSYMLELGKIYSECPKAILAAIAVSSLTQGGDYIDEAKQRLANEWLILPRNSIVQKPIGEAARMAKSVSDE